jgi:predicted Zn-dependent protease
MALKYVHSDWVLVLDADERLIPGVVPSLQEAIQQPQYLVINLLRQEVGARQSPYSLVSRLFRRHPAIAFARPYHAMIDDSVERLMQQEPEWQIGQLAGVAIAHYGYQAERIVARNKFTKAQQMMEGFLNQHPTDPYVCSKLGALYIEVGQTERGLTLLERGLTAAGINPATQYELHYHLGSAYAGQNQLDKAEWQYRQALEQPIVPQLQLGALKQFSQPGTKSR